MRTTNKVLLRIIKAFYGIEDPFDEYKLNEVNRIGNNAFLLLFSYTLLSNLIITFIGFTNPRTALASFIFANILFSLCVVVGYISMAVGRLHLNNEEVTSANYPKKLKGIRNRAVKVGIIMGIYLWFVERFLDWYFYNISYIDGVRSLNGYVRATLAGFVFGLAMYIYWRSQLKKVA